jgi:hypothetical protein
MRNLRALAVVPVASLLFVACGGDKSTTDTAQPAVETTVAAVADTTVAASDTSVDDTTPITAIDGPVQIDVMVGVDSSETRVEKVKVGNDVTLNITNPNAADSYHVHVVDLEQDVEKGVTATFNFVADTVGTIEVESHITEKVLVVIEVV